MNADLQRVTQVVDWVVFKRIAENKRDLSEKIGYTESSLSQILNGRVPLSEKFVKKLSKIDNRINLEWILTGKGDMLKTVAGAKENVYLKGTNLSNENEEPLNLNDMEKNFLMTMLKGSQSQIEQFLSQQEKMLSQQEKMLFQQDELIAIIKNLTSRKNDEADSKKKPAIGDRSKEKGGIEPSPTKIK